VQGFVSNPQGQCFNKKSALSVSSSATEVSPFSQPPRCVRDELPIVYVYDHCPFCVRVRLALGVKNVKHNVHFLANDDIPTPTKLLGKKIAPIFAIPEDDLIMGESLDIIAKVEGDERFGPTNVILPATGRTDIKAWQKSVQTLLRTLQRPRYVATGLLPEFQQIDGRHAFIKNHQLPPYEKPEWKGDGSDENPGMDMDEKLKLYAEAMAKDPAPLLEDLNAKLIELDDMIYSEHYCSEGGLSMDDIDLWARLRSITIIKGVEWPNKLRSYMDNLSALGDVPLYDQMAL
jgi:glutaredoxin 2